MPGFGHTLRNAKRLVSELLFPLGSQATIRLGPLKGCRYVVTEQSGWSPILGRWEPEAQRLYGELISAGEIVWDLGANTGIHTLLFARIVGPSGKVVAFEPLRVNVEQIVRTCELNGIHNVVLVEKAVSDSLEPATFHTGQHDKQGSLVGIGCEDGGTLVVQCLTLDSALDDSKAVDFVKIDIEGAESRALHGFTRVAQDRPTFAIDLHTPTEDVAVGEWLRRHGYRAFRLLDTTAHAQGQRGPIVSEIQRLDRGWPTKDGIWGTVIAVHPSREAKLTTIQKLAGRGAR